MSYWLREIGGWALVVIGLFLFYFVYLLALEHRFIELWAVLIAGIFVFRGGIHLLKVAIAARVCQQAQERLYPAAPPRSGAVSRRTDRAP